MSEPAPRPTEALVTGAKAGDAAALEELLVRYGPRALGIVRIRMGERVRAAFESADLVQEALADALAALPRFEMRGESSFIRWLAVIVEHRIRGRLDHLDAAKRSGLREVSLEGLPGPPATSAPSPSAWAGAREERTAVEEAVAELPERYRELIALRDYAGASWEEVARETGASSPAAARMAHARALTRLGRRLRERGLE